MASTLLSTNRWSVFSSQTSLAVIPFISGRVAPGSAFTILNYLCERFDAEVEPIRKDWSWGWAYRAVRGKTTGFSNHASGTAVDLNAPAHPMWKRGTFSTNEKAAVRRILHDIGDGVIYWGEDYKIRADGMHFEINLPPSDPRIAAAAYRIRNLGGTMLPTAPAPVLGVRAFSAGNVIAAYNAWMAGKPIHVGNVSTVQAYLNRHYKVHKQGRFANPDGYWGPDTQRVYNAYRSTVLGLKGDAAVGAPGVWSLAQLLGNDYSVR